MSSMPRSRLAALQALGAKARQRSGPQSNLAMRSLVTFHLSECMNKQQSTNLRKQLLLSPERDGELIKGGKGERGGKEVLLAAMEYDKERSKRSPRTYRENSYLYHFHPQYQLPPFPP